MGATIERLGLRVPALLSGEFRQSIERFCHLGMMGTPSLFPDSQRALKERFRKYATSTEGIATKKSAHDEL